MINNRKSGVPTSEDDDLFFHIRFALEKHINPVDFIPSYCVLTIKVEPAWVKTIFMGNKGTQFDASSLKEESIEGVWKIIGEQYEWLLNLLNAFKDNANIPANPTRTIPASLN